MSFLHTEFDGDSKNVVIVTIDHQANVMLLDEHAFRAYQSGGQFTYHGGWASKSPVRLSPPTPGRWHVVVDLGGRAGQVRAGIRIGRAA